MNHVRTQAYSVQPNGCRVERLKLYKGVVLASLGFLISTGTSAASSEKLSELFRFEKAEIGTELLFIRRGDIVASLTGFDDHNRASVERMLKVYSLAAGVDLRLASSGANLVLVRARNVNAGDKLNTSVLIENGAPPQVVSAMKDTTGWSQGCGSYTFKGKDNRISVHFGLIDENLDEKAASVCMKVIIDRSFGIGLGASKKSLANDNIFTTAYLIESSYRCAALYESKSVEEVKNCINQLQAQ